LMFHNSGMVLKKAMAWHFEFSYTSI
jgi:hypothetical protein